MKSQVATSTDISALKEHVSVMTRLEFKALCIVTLLAFSLCEQSNAAEPVDECTVSSMQTGVRPGAAGPPTRVLSLIHISEPTRLC